MDEIADKILDPSIISQALAAAEANPDLRIRCPWCHVGFLGSEYANHAKVHERKGLMDAIILAGGKGSRLAPWPAPKCLLPVNGVPILIRLLDHLFASKQIQRAIVCTGYRGGDVSAAIGASHYGATEWNAEVLISDAGEDAPMGVRLHAAQALMTSSRALICYGDELADVDVGALAKHHEATTSALTFTTARQKIAGGVFNTYSSSSRVTIDEEAAAVVNVGFVVAEKQCWDMLNASDGVSTWINRLAYARPVSSFSHEGKRATVNSLADLAYAEEVWK